MRNDQTQIKKDQQQERPPVFKTWRGWYVFVLVVLALLIVVFYLFTQHYSL